MKLKALLLCGGLLATLSASAALNITERTAPQPETTAPVVDGTTVQYLYNIGTRGFFLGANDHLTRASICDTLGYKVKFENTSETTGASGTVAIWNYIEETKWATINDWKKVYAVDQVAIWIDNNEGNACNTWVINSGEGNTFTISNTAFADVFLGAVSGSDTRLYMYAADHADFAYQWAAVSEEAYAKFDFEAVKLYDASVPLLAVLKEADSKGVTGLDEWVNVYNNAVSTVEQLEAATAAVNNAIAQAAAGNATAANPADLTNLIAGADMSSNSGWSYGSGSTKDLTVTLGNGIGELYGGYGEDTPYDAYQTINNLKPGVYAFGAQGFHRTSGYETMFVEGSTKDFAVMYAIDPVANDTAEVPFMNILTGIQPDNKLGVGNEVSVTVGGQTYYVPDNLVAAAEYMSQGYYNGNKLIFAVTGETASIGIKNLKKIRYNWTCFDNLTLKYYGNGQDAYQLLYDDLLKNVVTFDEDALITKAVLEEYNETVEEAKKATVASKEEVYANYKKVTDAQKVVEENIAAWAAYQEQYLDAKKATNNYQGSSMEDLDGYLMDVEDYLDDLEFTTEELIAETQKLKDMIAEAIQNAIVPGSVYDQLKNVDFADGFNHWNVIKSEEGNGYDAKVKADQNAKCAEAFNMANFDVYQMVENAPVGCYEISFQGFYRGGRGDDAWSKYFNKEGQKIEPSPEVPVSIYLNDNKTPIAYVYDYQVNNTVEGEEATHLYAGTWFQTDPLEEFVYPNDMASAGKAFDEGAYSKSAFGLVAKKGDALRIGLKGVTNQFGDSWAIFTRFKLVFHGYEADIVAPELRKAIDAIDLTKDMGADVKVKAEEVKTTGENAYNATPQVGKDMFDALAAIFAYNDSVAESVAIFADLKAAVEEFTTAMTESTNDAAKLQATRLLGEIGADKATYTNAQAKEAIEKLAELQVLLAWPGEYTTATDEEGVDFTAVIKTPEFSDEAGNNSMEGWTATNVGYGPNEHIASLVVESYDQVFDIHQTVSVPNGMYEVSAKAFARHNDGNSQKDYELWASGVPANAIFYAVTGEADSVYVNIEHQASDPNARTTNDFTENYYTHDPNDKEALKYYVPNTTKEFRDFLDQNSSIYKNSVNIKVTNGKLKIGFKSDHKGEWVIMDDVTLTYFGENSTKEEIGWTTDIQGTEVSGEPAKVEVFHLTGAKAATMQKGFNIVRMIDANGNVKVRKVIVK